MIFVIRHLLNELSPFLPLLPLVVKIGSPAFRRRAISWLPIPAAHRLRDAIDIMEDESKKIVNAKRATASEVREEHQDDVATGRKDIMSVLCEFLIPLARVFEVQLVSLK